MLRELLGWESYIVYCKIVKEKGRNVKENIGGDWKKKVLKEKKKYYKANRTVSCQIKMFSFLVNLSFGIEIPFLWYYDKYLI